MTKRAATMGERQRQTKLMARYLDSVRTDRAMGKRSTFVQLGRLDGFPNMTDDPDVVDKAADEFSRRADAATSTIAELKARQRAIELRAAADELRAPDEDNDEARAMFMEHGAQWAAEHGISYAAFRELGIPAAVLREAGIAR